MGEMVKEDHVTSNCEACESDCNTLLPANVHTNSLDMTTAPGIVTNDEPGDAEEIGTPAIANDTHFEKCECYTNLHI